MPASPVSQQDKNEMFCFFLLLCVVVLNKCIYLKRKIPQFHVSLDQEDKKSELHFKGNTKKREAEEEK